MVRKIVGVIGSGMIGDDPFGRDSWSGSSFYFFSACEKRGILSRAFGFEVPALLKYLLIAKNFDFNMGLWRRKFYMDSSYRRLLTKQLDKYIYEDDFSHVFLQIGAAFSVPEIIKDKTFCCSYHDGNFAAYLKSPFKHQGLKQQDIQKCLDFETSVYRAQDHIFTMSDYLRQSFIEDFNIDEKKVSCIGCGINMDYIPEVDKNKDYDRKEILFVGKDFERKGGIVLLEAFKKVRGVFPEAVLHIVGPGEDVVQSVPDGVTWHGFINKHSEEGASLLEKLYNNASIFVLPSLYEPFGIAPLEAMVCQIPCIVTGEWALRETVNNGLTGLHVACNNVDDLAEKIIYLLTNPDKIKEMGISGRSYVLDNHLWSNVADRLAGKIAALH